MDLINRVKLVDLAKSERETCGKDYDFDGLLSDIENAPSLHAVPMDKLCEWLERNAAGRWNGLEYTASGWKDELTKWMEEQNGFESMV